MLIQVVDFRSPVSAYEMVVGNGVGGEFQHMGKVC